MNSVRFFRCALALLLVPTLHAINVSESTVGDFPNSAAAVTPTYTYTLTAGSNVFSGQILFGSSDTADFFKVVVPAGLRIASIQTAGYTAGGFVVPSPPAPAGTYTCGISPGQFINDINWTITFTVRAVPDYDVSTNGQVLTLTNNTNHADTLSVTEQAAGNIAFAASGRTFSTNLGVSNPNGTIVSLSGITAIVINGGAGGETINVGGFSGSSFPALSINGGAGNDTVSFTGNITFVSGSSLSVNGGAGGADTVNLSGAQLSASGSGAITILCSKNVTLSGGAVLQTTGGNIDVEANQQPTVTTGNFIGVNLDGVGTAIKATGGGSVTVRGTGGNDPGGSQLGVEVVSGAKISSVSGTVLVAGGGGASTGIVNRGVTVYGSGSAITSGSNAVSVLGVGGGSSNAFGIGVSVLYGGQISGAVSTSVQGIGAGGSGSGANQGVEVAETGSLITSSGDLFVAGTAGPGASTGVTVYHAAGITLASTANNQLYISADSVSFADTANVTTTAASSSVTFAPTGLATQTNLGGTSTTGALGLADADLDHVSTPFLGINGGSAITISSPITRPTAGTVQLNATVAILASASGVDLSDGNGTVILGATLACPITGAAADSGYPQFNVAGNINLNLVALDISGSTFAGASGNQFTIVKNSGAGTSTSSHFANLLEGAYLAWPGNSALAAQITYVGGTSGHDVVLTLVPVANALRVTSTANDASVGSLPATIAFAAAHSGADIITFDPTLGGQTITLTGPVNGHAITIADSAGVTIDASGLSTGLTIQGGGPSGNFALFRVNNGATLTLRGLTLANGGGSSFGSAGGAIYNDGTVTLTQCTFWGNSAFFAGGAIYNTGTLKVTECTFSGNSSVGSGIGGAIYSAVFSTLTVAQSTLSGNSATQSGGAIEVAGNGLTLANSIVAGNTAPSGADINNSSILTLVGANIVQSLAGNAPTGIGTIINAAPVLAALGSYGGPTQTMPPLPGSPALDRGDNTQIPIDPATGLPFTTDQRGFARISNGTADIGAVETSAAQVTVAGDNGSPGTLRSIVSAATDVTTTITFAPGLSGSQIPFIAARGQIPLTKNFAIDASALAGGITITAGTTSRIFSVSAGETVVLSNLTLTGGNGFGTPSSGSGGAILNNGATLTLNQCTLSNNSTSGSNAVGGAIRNAAPTGSLTLNRCTVANNTANTSGGNVGGVACFNAPTTVNQCTFSGNSAVGVGGALSVAAGGSLAVNQSTIAGNNAATGGGGTNNAGTTALTNSIVATNTGSLGADINNGGTLTRAGRNIIGDNDTVATQFPAGYPNGNGDYAGTTSIPVNPLLAPLGDYGGPTPTLALLMGTPAHNAAVNSAFTSDQRGFPITDGVRDIGAYEAGTLNLNFNAYIWETLPAGATVAEHAAAFDFDGDGMSNLNEFLAQTNAANSSSYLHITQTTFLSGALGISFPSVVGVKYNIETSSDLNTWSPIELSIPGTGSPIIRTYGAAPPQYFLRARVVP